MSQVWKQWHFQKKHQQESSALSCWTFSLPQISFITRILNTMKLKSFIPIKANDQSIWQRRDWLQAGISISIYGILNFVEWLKVCSCLWSVAQLFHFEWRSLLMNSALPFSEQDTAFHLITSDFIRYAFYLLNSCVACICVYVFHFYIYYRNVSIIYQTIIFSTIL